MTEDSGLKVPEALSPEPRASVILPRFVARGDFTDLMGRAAYGRPGVRLDATV